MRNEILRKMGQCYENITTTGTANNNALLKLKTCRLRLSKTDDNNSQTTQMTLSPVVTTDGRHRLSLLSHNRQRRMTTTDNDGQHVHHPTTNALPSELRRRRLQCPRQWPSHLRHCLCHRSWLSANRQCRPPTDYVARQRRTTSTKDDVIRRRRRWPGRRHSLSMLSIVGKRQRTTATRSTDPAVVVSSVVRVVIVCRRRR